jgi:protein-S-isoprenylcysteine O-methyltransferase Ste14
LRSHFSPLEAILRATEFEFRNRLFIIVVLFGIGFWCYSWDSLNMATAFAHLLMGHSVEPGTLSDQHVVQAILAFGAALAVLGALLRTWAAAYLRSEVVHDSQIHSDELVADGPYRYVRNPLYLGGMLFAVGIALTASRLGFLLIVSGLTVFYYRLIAREEALFRETQGESYRQFLAIVPRVMPSLNPRVAAGGLAPRWGQAVIREAFMWLLAVAVAFLAITLNQRVFLIITVSAVVACLFAKVVIRRKGLAVCDNKVVIPHVAMMCAGNMSRTSKRQRLR